MAITETFKRQVISEVNKTSSQTADLVEVAADKVQVVNIAETILQDDGVTSVTKLVARFKIKTIYSGGDKKNVSYQVDYILFPGNAPNATLTSATVPLDSTGSTPVSLGKTTSINLDTFFMAAGDTSTDDLT